MGLTASAGVAGWGEFFLLQRGIRARVGPVGLPRKLQLELWGAAAAAGLAGVGVRSGLSFAPGILRHPWPRAALIFGLFGATYL